MNLTLLLTASVNPNGMPNNILTNIVEREKQYINALRFYLDRTTYKIVFVENTLYDFSEKFSNYIKAGRLEYITFDGNNFDKKLVKGFGEGQIIKYAFETSNILNEAQNIMKITGRLQLSNIQSFDNLGGGTVYSNLVIGDSQNLSHNYIFTAPPLFFKEFFIPDVTQIDDSSNFYFEKYLYEKIEDWVRSGYRHSFFMRPLKVIGYGAADGHAYYKATRFEDLKHSLGTLLDEII